jgi:hypothetical protein
MSAGPAVGGAASSGTEPASTAHEAVVNGVEGDLLVSRYRGRKPDRPDV